MDLINKKTDDGGDRDGRSVEESSSIRKKTGGGFFKKPPTRPSSASDGGEDSDGSIMSVSSFASTASGMSRVTRKRGRKPEEGILDPDPKRVAFLKNKEGEEDDVFNPSVAPANLRSKAKLPTPDALVKEMQAQPTEDLGACIRLNLETIEKIADKSKNLKGDYVRGLRIAARKVQAATAELAQRTAFDANVERLERENAELRAQLADLTTKVERLTDAVRQQPTPSAKAESMAKTAPTTAAAGQEDWESRLMERISALMDRKLAGARVADPASSMSIDCATRRDLVPPEPLSKGTSRKKGKAAGKAVQGAAAPLPAVPGWNSKEQAPAVGPSTSWATVAKRKPKRPNNTASPVAQAGPKPNPKAGPTAGPKAGSKGAPKDVLKAKPKPSRLPASAAITLTVPEGSEVTYAAVMAAAKDRIKLTDLGLKTVRFRSAITGGKILEIDGPDCASKADALADRLREVLADLGVRVVRPVKTGELRLKDLDDSVTPAEVQAAVASAGGCNPDDVRVGDIRRSPTAAGTVWVRCPLVAVRQLAVAERVAVGWASARVDYLTSRPLQCFRCLEYGHVRSLCQSAVDRSNVCYACGEPDHRASQCTRPRKCPLCSEMGCKADHRMGSKQCSPPKAKRRRGPPPAPALEGETASKKTTVQSGPSPPPQEAMEAS